MQFTMRNYLLVHGAWHGYWCWNTLLDMLDQESVVHTVKYPQLKSVDITLEDYVAHICRMIDNIDGQITLVGHSFAGFVISEVACRYPERISELIYINGFVPLEHESLLELTPLLTSQHLTPYLVVDENNQELFLEPWSTVETYMYNKTIKEDIPLNRLRPEPLKPLMGKVRLSAVFATIPKRAIISRDDLTLSMTDQIFMCQRYQMPYSLIDADHCPFISAPFKLAELILS
ncbi:MAG: alpha/beta fold hydrolase [Gammaproteobacteria bacterium]|nr:alpha/beta fold hydrolase [Gammaproteobacteria bacterium]